MYNCEKKANSSNWHNIAIPRGWETGLHNPEASIHSTRIAAKGKKRKKKTHELCKMLKNVTKYFYCSTTDENGIHLDETVLIHFGCCWWWWNFWKTKSKNGLRLFIKRKNQFAFFQV